MTEINVATKPMYTTKQFAAIVGRDESTIKQHIKREVIKPDDIQTSSGRAGFRYLFSEETIRKYSNRVGLTPNFDAISDPLKLPPHKRTKKAIDELEKVKDEYTKFVSSGLYVLPVGNGLYVDPSVYQDINQIHLTDNLSEALITESQKDSFYTLEKYGIKVKELYFKEE